MIEKGMKKRGEMHIFSPICISMHIFSPIDLKCTKLPKKGWTFFACGAHHLLIINLIWGQNINQKGGGGQNMNFKLDIYPCVLHLTLFSPVPLSRYRFSALSSDWLIVLMYSAMDDIFNVDPVSRSEASSDRSSRRRRREEESRYVQRPKLTRDLSLDLDFRTFRKT